MKTLITSLVCFSLGVITLNAIPVAIDFEDASNELLADFYESQGIVFDELAFAHNAATYGVPTGYVPFSGNVLVIGWANGPGLHIYSHGGSWSEIGARVTGSGETTLTAYDMYGQMLGVASTGGDNTLGNTAGREANMLLSVSTPNIAYAMISNEGETRGLTVDDVTFNVPDISATWSLLALSLVGLLGVRRR